MQETLKVLLNTSVWTELRRAVGRYGWRFPVVACRWAYYRLGDIWLESRFDRTRGVHTGFIVAAEDLAFDNRDAQAAAVRYRPTPPFTIGRGLALLRRRSTLDFRRATFIDYGCGAGRVLFIAREAGFERAIGIELSPQLVATCRANIARSGDTAIEVLEHDAARYEPSDDARVFFFFVPFDADVYRAVFAQIEASVRRAPRTVYVIDIGSRMKGFDFADHGCRMIGRIEKLSLFEFAA